MRQGRLLIDAPARGSWNMAVDQALLESVDRSTQWILRFYFWSPPTLSLGYFQPYASRREHAPSQNCQVVRRATGGGAILHDRELTYSLCVPSRDRWSDQHQKLVESVHGALIDELASVGIACELHHSPATGPDQDAFLCFQRRSHGDVLLSDCKIAGSAQRRVRNALLQHGSILLRKSAAAPELDGIEDLANVPPQLSLIDRLSDNLGSRLGLRWKRSGLFADENERAHQIEKQRFAQDWWTKKR